ncbi:MAG: ribulose bisphosphate carboxylase small subunit [Cyanobacteria bacterium P01_D01_bin.156]
MIIILIFLIYVVSSEPTITSAHEAQIFTQVEQFLGRHPGDYVRLLSIDPKAKQRQLEKVIQKPE